MPTVESVSRHPRHRLAKAPADEITLIAGIGVEGDAHAGATVQHRSRKRWRPHEPNLRQVHLISRETLEELGERGFAVAPAEMGENVTTRGVDLLALPTGARLHLGDDGATIEVTGLRNPCVQLERWQEGLMEATLDRDEAGNLIRRAGVMAVVATGGVVRPGDAIRVELPAGEPRPLQPV